MSSDDSCEEAVTNHSAQHDTSEPECLHQPVSEHKAAIITGNYRSNNSAADFTNEEKLTSEVGSSRSTEAKG